MKTALSILLAITVSAFAGDDRFGFATHFEQGWSATPITPLIADVGAGWIRDDLYAGHWETSKGVYTIPAGDASWMKSAHAQGLKIVGILGSNGNYANNYDPAAMSNLATWIAKTGLVDALEVLNEPNNIAPFNSGTTGLQTYVTLINGVHSAVHSVAPGIPVIGTDFQGYTELAILGMGLQADGIVYHPYAWASVPEWIDEPGWHVGGYVSWVQAIQSAIKLPIWETEWNISTDNETSENNQAVFDVRRLLLSIGLGVQHTFIYDFKDYDNNTTASSNMFGVVRASLAPKQSYFSVRRLLDNLAGFTPSGSVTLVNSTGFAAADFYSVLFHSGTATIAAVWIGNHFPGTVPTGAASITFGVSGPGYNSKLLDIVSGDYYQMPTHSDNNWTITVNNMVITDSPQFIMVDPSSSSVPEPDGK